MEWLFLLAVFSMEFVTFCKALNCDNVMFNNGEITSTSKPPYKAGTNLTFKCDSGYKGIGRETITCLKNGHWSDPVPYCQAYFCSKELRRVENGRICRKSCSNHFNCKATFKRCLCDDVCGKSCFNPNSECPKPTSPEHGYVVQNELTYGHTISYGCDEGYSLSGPQTRRCRSDKKWSGFKPRCVEYGVCGQAGDVQQNVKSRVIEGINAKEGAWPWQALLFRRKKPFNKEAGFAGGTIISKKWILTAAHIHIEFPSMLKNKSWKEMFMIAVGFLRYPNAEEQVSPNADFFEPKNFIIHSMFDEVSMDYDIALISVGNYMKREGSKFVVDKSRTSGMIQFTQYIRPACLPCMKDYSSPVEDLVKNFDKSQCGAFNSDTEAGTEVIVTGFGYKRDPGKPPKPIYRPDSLQQGLLTVWSEKRCIKANQIIKQIDRASRFTERMICARSADETKFVDSCYGDSGGPIVKVVGDDEQNRWVQIGIVSWGLYCGNEHPGFYTSVTSLMPWIIDELKEASKSNPETDKNENINSCNGPGFYKPWSKWSECTENNLGCAKLRKQAHSSCSHLDRIQTRGCGRDRDWGPWEKWSECSATCGGGSRVRRRIHPCTKSNGYETRECNTDRGKYLPFGEWSECSQTCAGGIQVRTAKHTCGMDDNVEVRPCGNPGTFGAWSKWSSCSSTCIGKQSRRRIHTCRPTPQVDTRLCGSRGSYAKWSDWSPCSSSCNGSQTRYRFHNCDQPVDSQSRDCQAGTCGNEEVADGGGLDLFFLLDESDNVGEENFNKSLDFAMALTAAFCGKLAISPSQTRIGAGSFYNNGMGSEPLYHHLQKDALLKGMGKFRYNAAGARRKRSCLPLALRFARMQFNSQKRGRLSNSANKLILLITSGCSDCGKSERGSMLELNSIVKRLHMNGVSIVTFIVGEFQQCLSYIKALSPGTYCNKIFSAQNWKELEDLTTTIRTGTCMDEWPVPKCR